MNKPKIQYLQFVMPLSIAHDPSVFFISEHLDNPKLLVYSSFIKYLNEFNIKDKKGLLKELDSFQNIFLDNLTGEWKVVEESKENFKVTHDQLLKLNQEKKPETWVEKGYSKLQSRLQSLQGLMNAKSSPNRRK